MKLNKFWAGSAPLNPPMLDVLDAVFDSMSCPVWKLFAQLGRTDGGEERGRGGGRSCTVQQVLQHNVSRPGRLHVLDT